MVELGGQSFASVAKAREYVLNLLHKAPVDEHLSGTDGKMIHELFLHHPEAERKLGGLQIENVKVGTHPQAGARAFCIVRSDGTEETFSMKKCISSWGRKATRNVSTPKSTANRRQAPQPKLSDVGLKDRIKRVITLHNELGREIQQIQKLLADD